MLAKPYLLLILAYISLGWAYIETWGHGSPLMILVLLLFGRVRTLALLKGKMFKKLILIFFNLGQSHVALRLNQQLWLVLGLRQRIRNQETLLLLCWQQIELNIVTSRCCVSHCRHRRNLIWRLGWIGQASLQFGNLEELHVPWGVSVCRINDHHLLRILLFCLW